ncbi:hypothetical protein ONE63_006958 [Megalurothrips usitatus]|uniref:Uncharacterized protein n=1 Tax=Megalurothrips usitatus TaxID=439358 RepID=A0AAV7XRB4_9NEOP|nr:hypothetical protein ONE63_006958 [Megalurothrips usitatus]
MRSLPQAADRRFLHAYLTSGPEKVGLLLSGSNFVSLPQVEMPITRFSLPAGFSLAESARLHADYYSFPTLLVVDRDAMSGQEVSRLALVGDFTLFPEAIRVSNDVAAPAAAWGRRNTAAFTSVNGMNSAPRVPTFAPKAVSLPVNPFTDNARVNG